MIDFRYHITSIAGIFIALAVGIIIGSGLVGGPSVKKQNSFIRQQIHDIQTRFNTLTIEIRRKDDTIRDLQTELDRSERLARAMIPSTLRGRLAGRNVAIIQTGDYKEATAAVQSMLKNAGANVTSVTRVVLPKRLESQAFDQPTGQDDAYSQLPAVLAAVVAEARNTDTLQALVDSGLLVLTGDYKRWNRLVVIVGGARREYQKFEVVEGALINQMKARSAIVVGCEISTAKVTSIPTYQREKISTVDNIDRAAGQISLAFALAGEKGDYGAKPTADRFLPPSIESGRSR